MDYVPKSVDIEGLLSEERELLERLRVIQRLKEFLGVPSHPEGEHVVPVATKGRPALLQDEARAILAEANGQPLHGNELLTRLRARGVRVGGTNPKNTLFGTLNRKKDTFRNLGSNMWVLVDRGEGQGESDGTSNGEEAQE